MNICQSHSQMIGAYFVKVTDKLKEKGMGIFVKVIDKQVGCIFCKIQIVHRKSVGDYLLKTQTNGRRWVD